MNVGRAGQADTVTGRSGRPVEHPGNTTKYDFYRSKWELTADAIHAWACLSAPDQYDSAVSRISARDATGSRAASESI